jgi:DNA-binding transcriptional MerR regulator
MARVGARAGAARNGAGSTRRRPPRVEQARLPGTVDASAPAEGFGGPQVCTIVGITYRQLDYWARTDLVRPSLADAQGSGTQRRYTYRDLVRLRIVKSLLDAGVKLQTARKAIEYLRGDLGDDEWESASIVLDGSRSVLARNGEALVDLVRRGQGVLNIVPLGSVVHDLDARIVEFATESQPAADELRRASRAAAEGD